MWPSMWIFDRCACFPYLHPSHTLSHTICISLFFSLLPFSLHPSSDFRNFPWDLFKYWGQSKKGVLSFSFLSYFLCPSTTWSPNFLSETICSVNILQKQMYLELVDSISSRCKWKDGRPWLSVHLKADSLTSLLIMIFDLPADHETLSSHPLPALPAEPQEKGSCDPVVCAAMERPITAVTWQVSTGTDATMWALFSNKLQLPRGPFHTGNVWTCMVGLDYSFLHFLFYP